MKEIIFYNLIGFPNENKFKEICLLLDEYGCEFLEVGIPSDNPHKEGQTIFDLHQKLKSEISTKKIKELLLWIKEQTNLKIILMTYYDGFKDYELDKISADLYSSILCVDNDLKEYPNIRKVKFYHSDMSEQELKKNVRNNSDFCYVNSGNSKTGESLGSSSGFGPLLEKLGELTNLPLYVGFGIKTKENIKMVLENGADGAVIGSEFIKQIQKDRDELIYLKEYLKKLKL